MEYKEKQIEEIFNDIVEIADRPYYYDNKGHAHIDFVDLDKLAEKLSEKYQPKLPEDSVVLSKEEKDKTDKYITDLCSMIDNLRDDLKKASNETAEKIITKIKQFLNSIETVKGDNESKLQPEIGYKCSEVDDFLDEIEKTIQG